jgi:hypothetical protein
MDVCELEDPLGWRISWRGSWHLHWWFLHVWQLHSPTVDVFPMTTTRPEHFNKRIEFKDTGILP